MTFQIITGVVITLAAVIALSVFLAERRTRKELNINQIQI